MQIQEYEARLGAQLQEVLRAVPGLRVLGPASPSIPLRSFTADGLHHSDVASLLDQEAVAVRAGPLCLALLPLSLANARARVCVRAGVCVCAHGRTSRQPLVG
eukprot:GHVU01147695.1.p3 GENE.GHVU01147695.1~~GHVU01147695.1.p3  ORF type:complete len:103 (-),score=9.48 GHVU01147695.1:1102-1410(-)